MPRAHRHYLPGHVWHITHRCHKKEFLLKFSKDRDRWLHWLFEAKKRYEICILNFMVTSNHIHLLVLDNGTRDTIPNALQLIAGRTGQDYNRRKNRKGAFWEDRYHATAVERDDHFIKCLIYIDLNMVRAGVVAHPSEWSWSGYNEIQNFPERYNVINHAKLMDLLGIHDHATLAEHHQQWINDALKQDSHQRESKWTESIAVGSRTFVEETKTQLQSRAKGRKIEGQEEVFELRDKHTPYYFDPKNSTLSHENTYLWDDTVCIVIGWRGPTPRAHPQLSAMKNSGLFLPQMYTDEKPSQIHADDYRCVRVQHCDTPPLLSTSQRSAHEALPHRRCRWLTGCVAVSHSRAKDNHPWSSVCPHPPLSAMKKPSSRAFSSIVQASAIVRRPSVS